MPRRKSRSAGAPPTGASEWIGGWLRPPWFIGDRDEPYRPEVVLWLEQPSGLIVGQALFPPEEAPGALGRALREALERPLFGTPRRPAAIRVADPALAAEVRGVLVDSIPITVAPTPELDDLLDQMVEGMRGTGVEPSYLEGGRISPERVAKLFGAAELLFRVAPWKVAGEDQVLRMDIPAFGVEGACVSIIGRLGESLGVLVFPSLTAWEAFCSAAEEAAARKDRPRDLGSEWLALDFVRGADLPASMRREVARHGWPVAGPQAYPVVMRHERDGAARPLVSRDVEIATACATSLAAFFVKHPTLFEAETFEPVCESWFDADDLEVRFTAPYEAFELFEIESPAAAAPKAPAPGQGPRPGRNAPCPCGSGAKYKKCCLPRDEAARVDPGGAHPLHALDRRLVRAMAEFAARRFGSAWLRSLDRAADDPELLQLAWHFALFHERIEGRSVIDLYLAERHRRLSRAEHAWLEAQRAAWLSVWEVTQAEPGKSLALRDLLSGEVRSVRESTASRTVVVRDALLARVVDCDGVSLLCGVHPRTLPPSAAAEVVRRVRARLRRKGSLPVERLREEGAGRVLIRHWGQAVAEREEAAAAPIDLRNTDGERFLLTTDHFEIAPGAKTAVEEALAGMPGVEPPEPGEDPPHYVFQRPGNRTHRSWDNTIVGRAWIAGDSLRVEANSRERADALRAQLEAACGDRIRHRAREHGDPLSKVRPRGRSLHPAEPPPPEVEQLLLDLKGRHYADWIDEPLPALRGKTPRQAVRTADGRARVDVLLKEIENTEQRMADGAPFDVSALRRELGLEEGGER
jgi:hypothetical protein